MAGVTILEAIQKSTDFLSKRGVESARLDSELLLAHLLGVNRLKLYLRFGESLTADTQGSYRELIKRRGQREPLQHLVGTVEFCGIELAVNGAVLIPRQETELLAEQGWLFLKELGGASRFVDLGTGSGCIAIAILAQIPEARGVGIDISAASLEVARGNAGKAAVADRLEFREGNLFAALREGEEFDLVISNPPYIAVAEIPQLQPEVRDFDPHLALAGGADGLDYYRMIAEQAGRFLRPTGRLMLEFGDGQETEIRKILEGHNWIVEKILPDYSGRDRMVIATPAT